MPLGRTLTCPSALEILSASVPAEVFNLAFEYDLYSISLLSPAIAGLPGLTNNHASTA